MSVDKICQKFRYYYGRPRLGNKLNPLNEYIYILLSLQTSYWSFERVYREFKKKYPTWDKVDRSRQSAIAKSIHTAGLSNQKARHIKKALKKIKEDFGELSLRKLRSYSDAEMESYLLDLPGLGIKAARCIMLYSFARNILPVDTHTQRIAERLGLIQKVDNKKAHILLDKKVSKRLSYTFHVGCVVHGRTVCLHTKPRCEECFIYLYCRYYKLNRKKKSSGDTYRTPN